ncbi:MAG: ATP synthase F1 subunit epsilon [Phycisphaerae bacterium]
MSFRCVVVTPESQLLDQTVEQVILPAHDGLVGIQTSRAPLLVKLGTGTMAVDAAGRRQRYYIDGGVAQMKDNVLTLVTENAVPAAEIDREAARAELAEAEASKITPENDFDLRAARIKRAQAKLETVATG